MPSDVPGVADDEREPFGDAISIVNTRSWIDVLDRLKVRHDGRNIRPLWRMLDAATGADAVRSHYAGVLEPDGWTPIPLRAGSYGGEIAIGDVHSLIEQAFAVGADHSRFGGLTFAAWNTDPSAG